MNEDELKGNNHRSFLSFSIIGIIRKYTQIRTRKKDFLCEGIKWKESNTSNITKLLT